MSIEEFANQINGRQYQYPLLTKDELAAAKQYGYVIVTGASDDLMEFNGAIEDEGGCFDGGVVYFDKNGVSYDDTKRENNIEALWCDTKERDSSGNIITWTYKTEIPHKTFMIYEDDEPYCRGIIFNINYVK